MRSWIGALMLGAAGMAIPAAAQSGSGPFYAPNGYDLTALDKATNPGDDFFQYANGKYLERAVIPADRPTVSRRYEMTDRMEANVHQLLQQAASGVGEQPSDVRGKAGAFYASYMSFPRSLPLTCNTSSISSWASAAGSTWGQAVSTMSPYFAA